MWLLTVLQPDNLARPPEQLGHDLGHANGSMASMIAHQFHHAGAGQLGMHLPQNLTEPRRLLKPLLQTVVAACVHAQPACVWIPQTPTVHRLGTVFGR